jgi:hypothetical protein
VVYRLPRHRAPASISLSFENSVLIPCRSSWKRDRTSDSLRGCACALPPPPLLPVAVFGAMINPYPAARRTDYPDVCKIDDDGAVTPKQAIEVDTGRALINSAACTQVPPALPTCFENKSIKMAELRWQLLGCSTRPMAESRPLGLALPEQMKTRALTPLDAPGRRAGTLEIYLFIKTYVVVCVCAGNALTLSWQCKRLFSDSVRSAR